MSCKQTNKFSDFDEFVRVTGPQILSEEQARACVSGLRRIIDAKELQRIRDAPLRSSNTAAMLAANNGRPMNARQRAKWRGIID